MKISLTNGKLCKKKKFATLVARIARPESLAIWHRGRSHRRPNRSGSPNRRHLASLDLKKHPECVFLRSLAKKLFRIASDLGVCDSNRIAHRGCIARFGPLSSRHFPECVVQLFFSHFEPRTLHNAKFWAPTTLQLEIIVKLTPKT